jgi:hypothetical protein
LGACFLIAGVLRDLVVSGDRIHFAVDQQNN